MPALEYLVTQDERGKVQYHYVYIIATQGIRQICHQIQLQIQRFRLAHMGTQQYSHVYVAERAGLSPRLRAEQIGDQDLGIVIQLSSDSFAECLHSSSQLLSPGYSSWSPSPDSAPY